VAAAVVKVPALRRLARMDVDREERRKQVVRCEQAIDDRERVLDQERQRRILRQKRVRRQPFPPPRAGARKATCSAEIFDRFTVVTEQARPLRTSVTGDR